MGRGSQMAQAAKERQKMSLSKSPVRDATISFPIYQSSNVLLSKNSFANSNASSQIVSVSEEPETNDENKIHEITSINILHAIDPKVSDTETVSCSRQIQPECNNNVDEPVQKKIKLDENITNEEEIIEPLTDEIIQNKASTMAESCQFERSDIFQAAFKKEWARQLENAQKEIKATKIAFEEQMVDEKSREEIAKSAWEYQMQRLDKQIESLRGKVETVRDEMEECTVQLEKYQGLPERLSAITEHEELHQIMGILLSAATALRKATENRMVERLTEQTDFINCVLCHESPKQLLFTPCNHFVMCSGCHRRLLKPECPVCRQKINSVLRVMLA